MNLRRRNYGSHAPSDTRPAAREPSGDRDRLRALATELTLAEERERRRIAAGLHDQVGQLLGIAKVKLGEALAKGPSGEVARLVSEGRSLIDRAIGETRALTFELSSPVLHELGLEEALAALAERIEERHGIPCRFERDPRPAVLSEELAGLLHSIVRELLWNVVKHARATRVELAVSHAGDRRRIVVEDNGVGFEPAEILDPERQDECFGLFNARERLEHLCGTLEIDSEPGRGTRIVVTVPEEEAAPER